MSKFREKLTTFHKVADKEVKAGYANFTDINQLANEVEMMDVTVEDQDREQFDSILERYLTPVDPNNELTILDAVIKLGLQKANQMMGELLELHYEE